MSKSIAGTGGSASAVGVIAVSSLTPTQILSADLNQQIASIGPEGGVGYVLTSNGPGTYPSFQTLGVASGVNNINGGAAGSLVYQIATGATGFIAPAAGLLVSSGGTPIFNATPDIVNIGFTSATPNTIMAISNDGLKRVAACPTTPALSTLQRTVVLQTGATLIGSTLTGTPHASTLHVDSLTPSCLTATNGANQLISLLASTAGDVLISNGPGLLPTWGAFAFINLESEVFGILPTANGGIGAATASATSVFAGPASGGAAAPAFRVLAATDLPPIPLASGVSGVLPIASGGTGSATFPAISLTTGVSDILPVASGGTGSASFPLIPLTTGVSGVLPVASGGTGVPVAGANTVFAAPDGSTGPPAFRLLVPADLPPVSLTSGVSGILPVAGGGTGSATFPSIPLTTGVSGVLPVANGGTGSATYPLPNLAAVTGVLAAANGGTGVASVATPTHFLGAPPTTGPPAFRAIAVADLPLIPLASGVSGVLPVAGGGTGSATFPLISLTTGVSDILPVASGGTGSATFPLIPLPTGVSGLLPVANGGTNEATTAAHTVFAGSATTGTVAPAFRVLVADDLPLVSLTSGVSGLLPVASGGTGSATFPLIALTSGVSGLLPVASGGTGSATFPIISLTAGVSGVLPVANGGSGTTSVNDALVFAGPVSGGPSAPTFRTLATTDLPAISLTSGVSGTLPVASGGTGQVAAAGATFFGGPASGPPAAPDFRALVATDLPVVSLATGVTGTLAVANGGTGTTSLGSVTVGTATNCSGGTVSTSSLTITSGGSVNLDAVVIPVANGGTGATSLASVTVGNATSAAACSGNAATATAVAGGTANYVLYQSAAGTTAFVTPGTQTGFALRSNGTGAAPTYAGTPVCTRQSFTSGSGTYVSPAGCTSIEVRTIGGGGGGGGGNSANGGNGKEGGGGGGGGNANSTFAAGSYAYAVGGGGAGGAGSAVAATDGTAGSAGTSTTFSTLTAGGGGGGGGGVGSANTNSNALGGLGGTASGGRTQVGGAGFGGGGGFGGAGGNSGVGGAGARGPVRPATAASVAGNAGSAFGGGGSGGVFGGTGGAGAAGAVHVTEFY